MTDTMRSILEMDEHPVIGGVLTELKAWTHWGMAVHALERLRPEHQFGSWLHGVRHTERVILLGAVCAMDQHFDEVDTWYTMQACTYHDVGRRDDGSDVEHSKRSAQMLPQLVSFAQEDLRLLQAAIHAHSGPLSASECIRLYEPWNEERCRRVIQALRDADRLDRVRLGDMNTKYLQFAQSKLRLGFAQAVYDMYRHAW